MQINRQTYEEFFLLYIDGELNPGETKAVEDFIRENPDLGEELSLLKETVLTSDDSIIFENKELLYKKDERKIIPIPWFRISAAAILLIAFGIFGWLYLGEKETLIKQPVATVQKPVLPKTDHSKDDTSNAVADVESLQSLPDQKKKPQPASAKPKSAYAVKTINKPQQTKTGTEPKEPASQINNNLPDPAFFEQDVVVTKMEKENIDVDVKARQLDVAEEPAANNIYYTQGENDTSNEMIYFANTSLPKKTKLRGVFRKASRLLDKVTSLQ